MAGQLAHRGPDSDGSYADHGVALGFRRLAIIDLSEAGNQPFASEDGRLQLVHNGEIYNYRELRPELEGKGHRFRTATDTEVLLAAYDEWGERASSASTACGRSRSGTPDERASSASRDRFGVKPFYYRSTATASSSRASRRRSAPIRTRLEPNPRAVRDYLDQAYLDHTNETFFAGVSKLPPAHSLVFDDKGMRLSRYWQLEPRDAPDGDPAEAVRELFLDSVRLRLRSDVPVGTCLSGGIDSSAIAVAVDHLLRTEAENARPVGERQRTFTAYFEDAGFDERPFAQAVVERTQSDAHWISFESDQLVADLPSIVESQDEPFGSTSMAAQWYVLRAARRAGLTVMLDGQGGDEVFGGYRALVGSRLADLLSTGSVREFGRELRAFGEVHSAAALATATARPFAPERLTRLVRSRSRGSGPLVHRDLRGVPAPSLSDASLVLRTAAAPPAADPHAARASRSCCATRTATRWRTRSRRACPFLDYRLRRARLLAPRRRADPARPDEGRAAPRTRRPPAAAGA